MSNPCRAISVSSLSGLPKNIHLRRFLHPSSLWRTPWYAAPLRISGALHLGIFEQPWQNEFSSKKLFIYLANPAKGRLVGSSAESRAALGSGGDELVDIDVPDAIEIRFPAVGFRQPPGVGDHDDLGMDRRRHQGLPLNSPSPVFDINPFPVFNPQVRRRLRVDLDNRIRVDFSHPRNHPMLGVEVDR